MSQKQPVAKKVRAALAGVRLLFPVLATAVVPVGALAAQSYARLDLGGLLEVGGEAERYARVMQIVGMTRLTPWSIQPFSPTQNELLRPTKPNPWRSRFPVDSSHAKLLRASGRVIENTSFPYQVGAGPTWTGRGVTGEAQFGGFAFRGPFHLQVAPLGFVAQNASFALAPNGLTGAGAFRDARFPGNIDAPQRFGDQSYQRLTVGTSTAAFDDAGIFIAATTAPQHWGPASEFPLVLGPNAGGFPAVILGSSTPWNLWIAKVHARALYGRLDQSSFSPEGNSNTRLGEGIIGVIEPRGLPGLELGGARFLHRPWADRSFSALARPFSQIVGGASSSSENPQENGVGSVFARLVVPGARSEFYGEFYKDDFPSAFHNGAGSLVENPDDYSAFALGFQHAIRADSLSVVTITGELVNGESSHGERLERGFTTPLPPYVHATELQGHTANGLILGSPDAYGGAGWRIGVNFFSPQGRRTIALERSLRLDWLPGMPNSYGVQPDVLYALRMTTLRFAGDRDFRVTMVPAVDLNRNLVHGHDTFNLAIEFSMRGWP